MHTCMKEIFAACLTHTNSHHTLSHARNTHTRTHTHTHSTREGKEERRGVGVLMLHTVLAGGGIICVSLSALRAGSPVLRALIASR
jgi:hypothetical protein